MGQCAGHGYKEGGRGVVSGRAKGDLGSYGTMRRAWLCGRNREPRDPSRWREASKIKMATIRERIRLFLKGKKIGPLTKYAWAKEKDCNKVLERTIDRPSLYNVGRLHSTWNPSSEGRWTLTFILGKKRDKKPLHFIESLNYFRDYIVDDNYRN